MFELGGGSTLQIEDQMPETRRDVLLRLPVVFGLSEVEAAAAVGLGVSKFRLLVQDGDMPRPRKVGSRRIYDVDELRAAFKALPHEAEEEVTLGSMCPVRLFRDPSVVVQAKLNAGRGSC